MISNETTPLLKGNQLSLHNKPSTLFSAPNRVLLAGFFISVALSFTQVPILYVFRTMVCEEFYGKSPSVTEGGKCSGNAIDAGTATQISILGATTTFSGVLNLFFAGWQIKTWGPRTTLVVQTAFPALRLAIQVVGVTIGAKEGIIVVQGSQIVSFVGGMSGYLLVLNTAASEVVPALKRTGMFGMLQGSVMLGTAVGFLFGGIVGDTCGIRRPFEIAAVLFALCSACSGLFIPYMDPKPLAEGTNRIPKSSWAKLTDGIAVLRPKRIYYRDRRRANHYGITLLAIGVFLGVVATGYAPMLIQMYATAQFDFKPTDNGYLMASNSLIRGIFLVFLFPKFIVAGRKLCSPLKSGKQERGSASRELATPPGEAPEVVIHVVPEQRPERQAMKDANRATGQVFDLHFLRWSLLVDGLVTASAAFATTGWHIYIAGFLLPLASGSAPASKGVVTEMCQPSERADALQAMTLVENIAMLSTLGLFGFIFSAFANIGKTYLTFYCNAVVAILAVAVLLFSQFPPLESTLEEEEDGEEEQREHEREGAEEQGNFNG